MRAVFQFSKNGSVQYISHLDLMRAMNRAIRRAGVPAKYSQGFHPHIIMSFAQALGLGYSSTAEYMEIELPDGYPLQGAINDLNTVLPAGLHITGAWRLAEEMPTLMASVSASRWQIVPEPSDDPQRIVALLEMQTIEVEKQGKNGRAMTDIRGGIYEITLRDGVVDVLLAAGSKLNIRPELMVQAAFGPDATAEITRTELYASNDSGFVPLYQICMDGETLDYGKDAAG